MGQRRPGVVRWSGQAGWEVDGREGVWPGVGTMGDYPTSVSPVPWIRGMGETVVERNGEERR